ncbi:unnamed protein product [Orchesella dallaii]|uniref:WD repeat-containing protein 44 n=1 Tax=Orchesella dallaii TaxID=48710 RepID=A0ABP1R3J1_9HEXA
MHRIMSSTSSESSDERSEDSSDEFYDAEEPNTGTLLRFSRKVLEKQEDRPDLSKLTPAEVDSCSSDAYFSPGTSLSYIQHSSHDVSKASLSSLSKSQIEELEEDERRRKRMEEMRRRLNTEEVEETPADENSQSDSQTSSVEGVYGAISGRTSHPFKVVDHDTVSLQSGVSIGRHGRIPGASSSNYSSSSASNNVGASVQLQSAQENANATVNNNNQQQSPQQVAQPSQRDRVVGGTMTDTVPLSTPAISSSDNSTNSSSIIRSGSFVTEPDVVRSCKDKSGSLEIVDSTVMRAPVAPPRRKRKVFGASGSRLEELGSTDDDARSKESTPEPFVMLSRQTSRVREEVDGAKGLPQTPPSPTVSIRSMCKEMDKQLESPNQKFWIVKAQDEEKTRAKSAGPKMLRRTESLPKDVIAAFDPSGTGSGGQRESSSRSNSNSSTLNNSQTILNAPDSNPTKVPTPVGTMAVASVAAAISNPSSIPKIPVNHQLSSIISAIAALEESTDAELQLNMNLRTRTDSGKLLSDLEILEQVEVLNLDTGERIPLSSAEERIPKCINPLSLHIMRLTSEYISERDKDRDTDEESLDSKKSSAASQEDGEQSNMKKKTAQVKRFLGSTVKKTVDKAKSLAHKRHRKEDVDISTNEGVVLGSGQEPLVKMKASHSHKGPYEFDQLQLVQDLSGDHSGPVWCMKFSNCGRLLATSGQDRAIRIWVLKDHLSYFQDMRSKNTSDKVSPTPSQESIVSQHSHHSVEEMMQASENSDPRAPFVPRPLCVYSGHTADLLDIAWSKSFFLLSSSMDRTVRLWHISRRECLCCFQHIDFVTAIAFHPRDDRYFLSGSLDGKLRLWNIPDKKVALWNEVTGQNKLITAANFCQNGKFAVVGTYDGRCMFFHTEQLKYHTQIIVHKGKKRLSGRKITGIEPMPGEDKILVTSNDSRIRLYDLRDLSLTCKYKGYVNTSSQIKGTFSHDGKYVVSGSENQFVYIWKTYHDYSKFSSARRDRNGYWEGIKAHNVVVTCAVFAPDPDIIVRQIEAKEKEAEVEKQQRVGMVKSPSLTKPSSQQALKTKHASACPAGYVLVSADFAGNIKVFFTKVKPKHSSLPASALV